MNDPALARPLPVARRGAARATSTGASSTLEQGTGTAATLDDVMREIHTLKGESRMLGLLAMNRVAHRTEDVLQHARRAQAFRDAALLEVAFAGLGLLRAYVEEPEATIASADEPRAQAFEARARGAAREARRRARRRARPSPSAPSPAPAAPRRPRRVPRPRLRRRPRDPPRRPGDGRRRRAGPASSASRPTSWTT